MVHSGDAHGGALGGAGEGVREARARARTTLPKRPPRESERAGASASASAAVVERVSRRACEGLGAWGGGGVEVRSAGGRRVMSEARSSLFSLSSPGARRRLSTKRADHEPRTATASAAAAAPGDHGAAERARLARGSAPLLRRHPRWRRSDVRRRRRRDALRHAARCGAAGLVSA